MATDVCYLQLIKFLTVAFVLAFFVYAAKANELILDLQPFPACTSCRAENFDSKSAELIPEIIPEQSNLSANPPQISREGDGLVSVTVLNPDLIDFDSVRFAVVEVADLEIAAEYLSYSLEDVNHDDQTDIVFYFSARDLIPSQPEIETIAHDTCLLVDIQKTDKTISSFNLCEYANISLLGNM